MFKKRFTTHHLLRSLNQSFPFALAEPWDHCGLQWGENDALVKKIFVTLDLDLRAVETAAALDCSHLLTHHPLTLKWPFLMDFSHPLSRILKKGLISGLNTISIHTNCDSAKEGINFFLAKHLSLQQIRPLILSSQKKIPSSTSEKRKIQTGLGRVGVLKREMSFSAFLKFLQKSLNLKRYLLAGPSVKKVHRIAVCGGAGGNFIKEASQAADIYVTGDIKHHQALEARALGLPLVDAGHCGTEKCFIDCVKSWSEKKLPNIEWIFDEKIEDPLRCPPQFL